MAAVTPPLVPHLRLMALDQLFVLNPSALEEQIVKPALHPAYAPALAIAQNEWCMRCSVLY